MIPVRQVLSKSICKVHLENSGTCREGSTSMEDYSFCVNLVTHFQGSIDFPPENNPSNFLGREGGNPPKLVPFFFFHVFIEIWITE